MPNERTVNWTPAGIYRDLFDGYVVGANRHQSLDGETAWHVTIYRNSGGDHIPRAYWVVGDNFQKCLKQTVDDSGRLAVETGGSISNLEEKAAIEKAIAKWETVSPA